MILAGFAVLVVAIVANIVALFWHERREFARADAREKLLREYQLGREAREQDRNDALIREVREMRSLALAAISQRNDLDKRAEQVIQNHGENYRLCKTLCSRCQ